MLEFVITQDIRVPNITIKDKKGNYKREILSKNQVFKGVLILPNKYLLDDKFIVNKMYLKQDDTIDNNKNKKNDDSIVVNGVLNKNSSVNKLKFSNAENFNKITQIDLLNIEQNKLQSKAFFNGLLFGGATGLMLSVFVVKDKYILCTSAGALVGGYLTYLYKKSKNDLKSVVISSPLN